MKKNPRSSIDKNKKYTYNELREESVKLYAQMMDKTLFEIVCVISCIWMHIMQDVEWELTKDQIVSIDEDKIVYRHSDKDLAVAHEELEKHIEAWENGLISTDDVKDVYKVLYKACRGFLRKTRRNLAKCSD